MAKILELTYSGEQVAKYRVDIVNQTFDVERIYDSGLLRKVLPGKFRSYHKLAAYFDEKAEGKHTLEEYLDTIEQNGFSDSRDLPLGIKVTDDGRL